MVETVAPSKTIVTQKQKVLTENFPSDMQKIFGDQLVFAFFYEPLPREDSHRDKNIFVCIRDHSPEIVDKFQAWHNTIYDQPSHPYHKNSSVNLVPFRLLKDHLNYALYSDPSPIVTNQRRYQGIIWAEIMTNKKICFTGNHFKFEKYLEMADQIVKKWQEKLTQDNQAANNQQSLKTLITYQEPPDDILDKAELIVKAINEKKEEIFDILNNMETYDAALDEIKGSLETLERIDLQLEDLKYIKGKIGDVSVFLPVNFPFYSYILYAAIIGFSAENVYVRCSLSGRKKLNKLLQLLEMEKILPNVKMLHLERSEFREKYVAGSDVIIFTGKYENANNLLNEFTDKLFIYNGAGVNPIVVAADADLEFAVKKIVDMRVFNSGQDCAGPDAILVKDTIYDRFLKMLIKEIEKVKIGDLKNPEVRVGKLMSENNLTTNVTLLKERKVIYGGLLNFVKGIIYPTIIESDSSHYNFHEFFAPVFNLVKYSNDQDLSEYFTHKEYQANSMYVTIFGNEPYIDNDFQKDVILKNKTVLDADSGYNPFGGYGKKTNFIYHKGKKSHFPIMIPRDIANCLKQEYQLPGN